MPLKGNAKRGCVRASRKAEGRFHEPLMLQSRLDRKMNFKQDETP
jgi:hypothetical protein